MKSISRFFLIALAIATVALTPYTPSPRRVNRDRTPAIQLQPMLRPSMNLPTQGLVVSDLNHGVTPTDLVNALIGSGVTISNVTYVGNPRAAGIFSGGAAILGFNSGIVIDSGSVQTLVDDPPCSAGVEGPNDCYEPTDSNSTDFALPGDDTLTLLSGFPTFDAAILEFDFVPQFSTVQFQYVFASDEYSDYSNTPFNDVFAFFVNGTNCALVPGTSEPVSINTINNGNDAGGDVSPHHPEFFIDNVRPAVTIDTQMDGLTVTLTCSANVTPGVSNHMKLAIADASDHILDAAAFLKAQSLISGTSITTSLTGGGQSGPVITVFPGTVVTDSAILSGGNAASATGTVSYKVFTGPNCATLFADAGTKTVTNGQVPNSNPVMFNQLGTYYWQASYSGDALNNPSSSACGEEILAVSNQTPTPTPVPTATPTPSISPTPTPPPTQVKISGRIYYCSDPLLGPVPNVTLTLIGTVSGSTLTESNGDYEFASLPSGGSFEVTPSKAGQTPGSPGINTIDVLAVQRHFLNLGTPLSGCNLIAADVNGDSLINTIDVTAIRRFYLGLTTGIANVGQYKFNPANRTYENIGTNQDDQRYDALIFGDVAGPFAGRSEGSSQTAASVGTSANELTGPVAAVILPNIAFDGSKANFIAAVTTTSIDAKDKLVGFQGDFTFDESTIRFENEPVQNLGLTSGNWNVSGNILPGTGPIRTLRISAYSNDFTPLRGSGALFGLRMTRVNAFTRATELIWAAPPDHFIFIDADLKTQKPGNAAPGSVIQSKMGN
jgi:hypothetical protein